MIDKPNVSFCIPAYNEENYIWECCTSIRQEAIRACHKWEIIVINNNSIDDTLKQAFACPDVSVINETKQGLVWSRTAGYKISKHQYLAFIDADCIMPKGWIDGAIKGFLEKDAVAVSGPLHYYDVPTYIQWGTKGFYKIARQLHKKWPTIQGGNFIVDRDALLAVGGFDTAVQFYGEDTMTAVKLSKVGKVIMEPEMWINSSGRRLLQQGVISTVTTYIANYLSINLLNRPLTNTHKDWR